MDFPVRTPDQVGLVLQGCRKARKISQATLAEQLGVAQSKISLAELKTSGMSVNRLLHIMAVLGLELIVRDPSCKVAGSPAPDASPNQGQIDGSSEYAIVPGRDW